MFSRLETKIWAIQSQVIFKIRHFSCWVMRTQNILSGLNILRGLFGRSKMTTHTWSLRPENLNYNLYNFPPFTCDTAFSLDKTHLTWWTISQFRLKVQVNFWQYFTVFHLEWWIVSGFFRFLYADKWWIQTVSVLQLRKATFNAVKWELIMIQKTT